MRKFAALVPLSAVLLATGACQSGDASDDATTATQETSPTAVAETTAPVPELDPAVPATPVFTLPEGLAANTELQFPYVLDYDHESWTYDIAAEGIGPEDHIFITSYLLPQGTAYTDYDARVGFIREYDSLVTNGAHEASHDPALISGVEGVFRFAIIRDGEGPTLYQRNFFMFAQNHVVQISCQWANTREIVGPLCGELQENFTLE